MTNLLCKIFIKNYKNIEDEKVRIKYGFLGSIFGIICNLFLFIIKLIFGVMSNSISIIGDGINNLTDMGSSVISFIGFKLSGKPADEDHPYGHQRIEYVTGLIISIVIIVVGVQLFTSSIEKIISKEVSNYAIQTMIVLVVSIFIKLYLAYFNKKLGKKINSLTLIATSKDSFNDAIATFIILISAIVSYYFKINIDGYMGVLVSLFICYSGYSMVKETISPLIGENVSKELIKNIVTDITNEETILGLHDLVCHSYGPTKIFMSVHVEVDASNDILYIHDIIDNIEYKIKDKYNVDLVIHMDPIDTKCIVTQEYKELVDKILQDISKDISFHDFRAVVGETHINLVFDISVPFDCGVKNEFIKETLNRVLNSRGVKVNLTICFERDISTIN